MARVASGGAFDPQRWLAARGRWGAVDLVFWLATLLPFVVAPSYLGLANQVAITAIFALSLDLILGYAGIISLGHAAYYGFGAYAAGLLGKWGWSEPFSNLVLAVAAAALLGWLTSFVVVRLRHLALIMVTLGIGLLLSEAANKASWLTGGNDGLQGVVIWPLFGTFDFDLWGYTAYTYSLVLLVLMFLLARRLVHAPFGLALQGIRENPSRMLAIGAPNQAHLRKIYTISAAMAGLAGALSAQTTQFVALDVLSFQRSADVFVMLVLGGTGRLYGGIVGAIIYMVARDQFADMNPQYWYFWIGVLLVAVVMFLPGGIIGGLVRLGRRLGWRG